jgi:hypothetical protein
MKILSLVGLTFVLTSNAFAGCPEDFLGEFAGKGLGNIVIMSMQGGELGISDDETYMPSPMNGKANFSDGSSVAISCRGDTLIKKFSNDRIEIKIEYHLDESRNLHKSDSPDTFFRQ